MFITEEELKKRLSSPDNLANRFRNGRQISYEESIVANELEEETANATTRGLSEEHFNETENQIVPYENEDPQILKATQTLEHREIKRPGNCRPWLSKQERTEIALEAISGRSQTEIARQYSVEPSTVSDIMNGKRRARGTDREVDQARIDKTFEEVRDKAVERLMSGLGQLTDDKISAHTGKDISTICANMAKVVQQTIPQESSAQQINLVVYAPELRTEKSFESVEVDGSAL